jgi:hypothetical protein
MPKIGSLGSHLGLLRHAHIVLPLLIGGCVADLFGERATSYNQEAAANKDRTILTNIVRASLGRPLQFTDITTVSGTASQSLSLAAVFPFAVHRPTTIGAQDTFSPTISLSGGPTFSIANLSTKEFYQGILSPIETTLLGYYLNEDEYPPTVLLPLIISSIIYTVPGSNIQNKIPNRPDTTDFLKSDFNQALTELLAIGLTAEQVNKPIAQSPALTEREAKEPRLLASLASGAAAGNTTLDLKRYDVAKKDDPNLSEAEYGNIKNNKIYYRLEKKNQTYRFCFDSLILNKHLEALKLTLPTPVPLIHDRPELDIFLDKQHLCGAKIPAGPVPTAKISENMIFQPRSVEGIILFLGDILRNKSKPEVFKHTNNANTTVLFTASEDPPGVPSISASVDGHTYYVSVDNTGKNMSSRVIQLLSELIALHNSAKDLPAPNVITVISP